MILEIPLQIICDELEHDGSRLVRPGPEPSCRRGFHPQELIQICAHPRGWLVETLEARPNLEGVAVKVPFELKDQGILLSARHAVVWTGSEILDPSTLSPPCRNYQQYLRFVRHE